MLTKCFPYCSARSTTTTTIPLLLGATLCFALPRVGERKKLPQGIPVEVCCIQEPKGLFYTYLAAGRQWLYPTALERPRYAYLSPFHPVCLSPSRTCFRTAKTWIWCLS